MRQLLRNRRGRVLLLVVLGLALAGIALLVLPTLTRAFGGDGIVQSDPTDGFDYAYAIALDSGAVYTPRQQATVAGCSRRGQLFATLPRKPSKQPHAVRK